eukprot:jgi/Mesvir1/20098/Mv25411-RA.1
MRFPSPFRKRVAPPDLRTLQLLEKSDDALEDFPEKRAHKRAAEAFVDALDIPASHAQLFAAGPASALRHLADKLPAAGALLPPRRPPRFTSLHRLPAVIQARQALRDNSDPARYACLKADYHSAIRQATKEQEDLRVREYFAHAPQGPARQVRLDPPASRPTARRRRAAGAADALWLTAAAARPVVFLPVPAARRPPAASAAWPSGGRTPGSSTGGRPA